MWSTQIEPHAGGSVLKVGIDRDASPVPYLEVLRRWQADADFRDFFLAVLADAPFPAFRWETPPITAATAHRPFEFVLLDSPGLAARPHPGAFAGPFQSAGAGEEVIAFANLGRDATLVVPRPAASPAAYGHLAAFVRGAPESQRHALWVIVGKVMERRLGPEPVWLSTAGAGVPWLHVRLDDTPKYYGHRPYRVPG